MKREKLEGALKVVVKASKAKRPEKIMGDESKVHLKNVMPKKQTTKTLKLHKPHF
jgi:hypothetical protein